MTIQKLLFEYPIIFGITVSLILTFVSIGLGIGLLYLFDYISDSDIWIRKEDRDQ